MNGYRAGGTGWADGGRRYRHSRVSGNPEMPAGSRLTFSITVPDSRLRGNDGVKGCGNDGRGRRDGRWVAGLQIPGQGFQFVQNFGEYRELVSFQGFVEQFRAGGRVVDAVVIGVVIPVQVVVL